MEIVDLRSDTVTRPSPAMRSAIAGAEVGDDSLGDDPTTRVLEERVADLLGMEAALFFPSGVMANQVALAVHGRPGTEVVLEADAHIFHYEEGAAAALSGLQLHRVATEDGLLTADAVSGAIRDGSRYQPTTSLIALENTHLASGGRVLPLESIRAIVDVARANRLPIHLDGARLWHAATETGTAPATIVQGVDSVMVALSKGLGAPIGSLLAASRDWIDRAWRVRRRFGGGMRQVGLLAAAGLYALDHHLDRLSETHEMARTLASGLSEIGGLSVSAPETNIVMIDVESPAPEAGRILGFLKERGILMVPFGPRRIRAVTHLDVPQGGVGRTVAAFEAAVRELSSP